MEKSSRKFSVIGFSVGFLSKFLFFPNLQVSLSSGLRNLLGKGPQREVQKGWPIFFPELELISPGSVLK